jgi:CP family cyanate transporter-like MFS transporter
MGVTAAIASVLVVPLAHSPALGWRFSLGVVIILPLAAILLWLPQLAARTRPAADTASPPHGGRIWRSALAWQVTAFMGLNSTVFYILVGWLPSMLVDAGYSSARAGSIHGLLQFASATPGLFLGLLVARLPNQKLLAAGASLLAAISFAGLWLRPDIAALWVICFGAASGSIIILCLIFFGLRTRNAEDAAALSGMAQSLGYLLAAAGPPVAGLLHDRFSGWAPPLIACIALSLLMMISGYLAGRPLRIGR